MKGGIFEYQEWRKDTISNDMGKYIRVFSPPFEFSKVFLMVKKIMTLYDRVLNAYGRNT